ncbi:hypothetical protein [Polyangium aurulentum]|uniref:hypothetical protein n=1 Tax=Polyangium aurulentum TaxID=2567896 RepID=UPI0010ADD528|nr:hypothetical protein [Polyangium aurulentum]UQA57989.1 hypothetical protein E8A73_043090 [Polyangium aurulentum]
MKRAALLALALSFVVTGCGEDPSSPLVCNAWAVADGGACRARAFTLPADGEALSGPGARRVSVAFDSEGRALVVWDEAGAVNVDELFVAEEDAGGGFSLHEPAEALEGLSSQGVVLGGAAGDAVVAWRQAGGDGSSRVFVSERGTDGAWIHPAGEEDSFSFGAKAYEPRVAARPSGETLIVWNQWYDPEHYGVALATRPSPGAPWAMPASATDVLSPPSYFSNAPQITVNDRGDGLISWYQSGGGPLMAFCSERFAGGAFSRPAVDDFLSAPGGEIDSDQIANPKPALAFDGRAAVTWTQHDGGGAVAIFLATRDAEGAWTRPASLADTFSTGEGESRDARAAFGPSGEMYVVWSQDEDDSGDPSVYLAQRAPGGEWVHPGKQPLVLSTPGAQAITPILVVGRSGGALVAWSERVDGRFRIAARRGGPEGFGAIEILSTPGEDAFWPAAAIGGPGERAVVAWIEGDPQIARVRAAFVE